MWCALAPGMTLEVAAQSQGPFFPLTQDGPEYDKVSHELFSIIFPVLLDWS